MRPIKELLNEILRLRDLGNLPDAALAAEIRQAADDEPEPDDDDEPQ